MKYFFAHTPSLTMRMDDGKALVFSPFITIDPIRGGFNQLSMFACEEGTPEYEYLREVSKRSGIIVERNFPNYDTPQEFLEPTGDINAMSRIKQPVREDSEAGTEREPQPEIEQEVEPEIIARGKKKKLDDIDIKNLMKDDF